MTLAEGSKGKSYKVLKIELSPQVKRQLETLGLTVGTTVSVLNKKRRGALIVKFRGTRFAVGLRFANGILTGGAVNE